ncbi:MAG: ClC family H(+)/Cl(-) exchange transporter [Spirochaetia bacterium]|jgi:H+/Cl- antiporter ClcA|nr:ClC family H(+)/Cl(-) exchange transporter [Spirochaetia bacterium]
MDKAKSPVQRAMRRWYDSRLAVIFESILIGFIVGFVVVLFRYALGEAESLRARLYAAPAGLSGLWLAAWIFALVLAGLFLGWAAKARPMIRGSGIPQIKGSLLRAMALDWMPELPLKIITGILGIGCGLSLGREGPSIQIGAYVGQGVLSLARRPHRERKILVTSASAAGLAAAFNAPLAGVLFVLEELQSSFSPLFIACAMGASMAADGVAGHFFGLKPVFDFRNITELPLSTVPCVILLGILCGLLGDIFKRVLYLFQDAYERLRIPRMPRPVLPLLLSVPVCFYLFDISGGGHGLIESLARDHRTMRAVLMLLAAKILFTAVCYGSGTSGGIFLPLLAAGALAGDALGLFLSAAGLASEGQILNFIILGMAAFFTGVVNAPVTGMILILEMSGNLNHLGSLVLACLSAFVTTQLIASRPVYTVLLERMLRNKTPAPGALMEK